MIFWLKFEGKLTIVAIHFSLRKPTVVSKIFQPETKENPTIVAILFLYEKSNRCFNDFFA